jgi:hypothetical protein
MEQYMKYYILINFKAIQIKDASLLSSAHHARYSLERILSLTNVCGS